MNYQVNMRDKVTTPKVKENIYHLIQEHQLIFHQGDRELVKEIFKMNK